jgi:nucleotide-binding universal stress UspA family protein
MKTVLLPTDGSDAAHNAIDYAIQMHEHIPCRFVLLHTFPSALHHPDLVGLQMTHEGKEAEQLLQQQASELRERYADRELELEALCLFGFMTDVIRRTVKEKAVDLIVMGTQGARGGLQEVMGSNTWDVIKHVPCPLIAVPQQASFSAIRHMVFAVDARDLRSAEIIYPLAEIALQFKAKLTILHVSPGKANGQLSKRQREQLESFFFNIPHEFIFLAHEDVAEGIKSFLQQNDLDMLAMITHQRGLLESLWHESVTKKLSLHSHVPVLALHDEKF